MFLAIEFQTLLQEEALFLLVEAESSVILEKLEQGLKEGLKAAVHEEEEQFGHGGLKLEWTGLEVMLLEPKLLERLDEFELEESFVLELTTGMFIGAEVAMMLSLSNSTAGFLANSLGGFHFSRLLPRLWLPSAPLTLLDQQQLRSRRLFERRRKN